MKFRKLFYTILSLLFILIIWKVLSNKINSIFILPSPRLVFFDLFSNLTNKGFWLDFKATTIRGLAAFGFSIVFSLIIGILTGIFKQLDIFFNPIMSIIKSTPVVSIILIAVLWLGSSQVPIFVSVLMTLPIMTESIKQGIINTDKSLLEMSEVYEFTKLSKLIHIRLPSLYPFFLAGARASLGLTWKVVIAGEILSIPKLGIGSALQTAKVQLETSRVFSLTIISIFLSIITDLAFNSLLKITKTRDKNEN